MKTIIWINDSMHSMSAIVEKAFEELWQNNYICKILQLGDNYISYANETLNDVETKREMQEVVLNKFVQYCINKEKNATKTSTEIFNEEKHIFLDNDNYDFKVANVSDKLLENYNYNKQEENVKELEDYKNNLINEITSKYKLTEDTCVALDLCLFSKDKNTLASRLIYHGLSKKKIKCLLYTQHPYREPDFVNNWKNNYKTIFNEDLDSDIIQLDDLSCEKFNEKFNICIKEDM